MFKSNKKLISFLIILLTILILLVGFLLSQNLLRNLSPDDSEAAGFGATADRSKFGDVRDAFNGVDCRNFLKVENQDFTLVSSDIDQANNYFKSCDYRVMYNDGGSAGFIRASIFPYFDNSFIDATPEDLYNRVHERMFFRTINPKENIDGVTYFYGEVVDATQVDCAITLFHDINDFEVGVIYLNYPNFKCDGEQTISLANQLAATFAVTINSIMDRFYP